MDDSFINHLANGAAPPTNPLHPEEFRRQGHIIIDFLADYYQSVESYPVRSQVEPGYLRQSLPAAAPHAGEPIKAILEDITKHIIPGLTHWQSPNYFAYFPCTVSTAGILGEMLSSGFNVAGFNWISSPAATELESIVMDWLGQTLKLPRAFLFSGGGGGVIQGTTCEAILCTMIAAREKVLEKIGREKLGRLVVYSSDQTHCSVKKAAKITGISPENYRVIPTTAVDNFALSPTSLRTAIAADVAEGLVPFFLCATVGTTSSTAVDPIEKLCEVASEYKMWVHVDAAYGGSACILPELRHLIDGVELASSFSLNAHKWLFTSLDCCCLWVKNPCALIAALSTDDAEYLKNAASETGKVVDYKDWQLGLSRRFRALKLWLVLRSYGVAGLRGFLRSHVRLAQRFEKLVAMDARFELVVPRTFALVCFRLLPAGTTSGNELSRRLLDAVNSSGRVCMSHAVVGGVYILRFAVGTTLTEERHVDAAWKVVQEHASTILTALNAHHTL